MGKKTKRKVIDIITLIVLVIGYFVMYLNTYDMERDLKYFLIIIVTLAGAFLIIYFSYKLSQKYGGE